MSRKFTARIRTGQGFTLARIGGIIDEDNQLVELSERIDGKLLVLDLTDIKRINSCGVRDWVNWLSDVKQRDHDVVMIRCSPAVVAQINMVTNFCGHAVVASVFAPYYCEACDVPTDKLLDISDLAPPVAPPEYVCGECGQPLLFDDFEESYFAFVDASDNNELDEESLKTLKELSPDVERKIRDLNEGILTPVSGDLYTPAHFSHLSSGPGLPARSGSLAPPTPGGEIESDGADLARSTDPQELPPEVGREEKRVTPAWVIYTLIIVALAVVVALSVLVFALS